MKVNEELLVFKYELGNAIAQWGYVEHHVRNIALLCVEFKDRDAMAISFHSIENFRSKVTVCDNLVKHKFRKSSHFKEWIELRSKLDILSAKRNKIAHGWHKLYVKNVPGRRWAIIPMHHADGSLLHVDGAKPPSGAICLRDLFGIRLEFFALTIRACNVYELLRRGQAPFPKSDEQAKNPPTIRHISALIRAEYGLHFLPSQKKS